MELLAIWKAADAEINTVLAMALSTLAFAAATFLTGWVKTKEQDLTAVVGDASKEREARRKLLCAKAAIKDLLSAFFAFSVLLAQSIFIDPLAVVGAEWEKSILIDSISTVGSLAVGMGFFLKAANNINDSAA